MIKEEERKIRVKRQKKLVEIIEMYNIKTSQLAKVTGLSVPLISNFKSGTSEINESNWDKLLDGISQIVKDFEYKPDVELEDFKYIINQLTNVGDVMVKKDKVKNLEQYLLDLRMNGFKCSWKLDRDGDYIFTDDNRHKPMVEVVIKPKTFIEQDLSIIDKVRDMHENALQLHEEAVVLQETTEQILNEVTNVVEEVVTGDEIIITEDDINEALNQSSHYELPKDEEEELKVLSDQLLEKNGIKDKSDKQSFIGFIKLKFTDEELKGFVRGMTILSVFDDEYKDAAFYIEYYMRSWMDERAMKGA